MAVNLAELVNDCKSLTKIAKTTQNYVANHPFRVDGITLEIYLHPMELHAELCRLALKKGRVSMYQQGHGATYRLAWYEEGQYHGLSFGYSNVKNFIVDESIFGNNPALLIPVRVFYNPNKASYYKTLRSKNNLNHQEVMTLLGIGLLQTQAPYVKPYEPTYLSKMLSYFARCTAERARRLTNDEIERPATVWKFKSGDIALDLPVPSDLMVVNKNVKSGDNILHKELQGDGKYGYTMLDGDLKVYPKNSLGVKSMRDSVNRAYRNNTQGIQTKIVGIPVIKMFGSEKPVLLDALLNRLLELANKYPVTRVERSFKGLDKEITFENGKMLTQTFNSLTGQCPDVVISNTSESKIDIILQGARIMKTQVDRHIGEVPPTNANRPLEIEAYKKRESKRTPLTRTEIGNIKYLCSLPLDKRKLEIEQYTTNEKYVIRNAMCLLSKSTDNAYTKYSCSAQKFRQGAVDALNTFSNNLRIVINNSFDDGTLDRVINELHECVERVNDKFGEEQSLGTNIAKSNQLSLTGMSKLNSCLTAIIETEDICGKYKYSNADIDDFVKEMKESDDE